MASKVFIDANILLDFTLKRNNYEVSKQIIDLVVSGRIQGYVTPSIIQICSHWLTKAFGPAKAKELLLSILVDITCIDTSHYSTISALQSSIKDMEDAIQYYTALRHKLDYFLSHDKLLLKESTPILPIYTCEEFLKETGSIFSNF